MLCSVQQGLFLDFIHYCGYAEDIIVHYIITFSFEVSLILLKGLQKNNSNKNMREESAIRSQNQGRFNFTDMLAMGSKVMQTCSVAGKLKKIGNTFLSRTSQHINNDMNGADVLQSRKDRSAWQSCKEYWKLGTRFLKYIQLCRKIFQ